MDLFMTRLEIRRLARATVGDSTDESVSSQQTVQLNAIIDQVAADVAGLSRWISTTRYAELAIDADQEVIPYTSIERARWLQEKYPERYNPMTYNLNGTDGFAPSEMPGADFAYVGPGNVVEASVWPLGQGDTNVYGSTYVPMIKTIIPEYLSMMRLQKQVAEGQLLDRASGQTRATINTDMQANLALYQNARGLPRYFEPRADGLHVYPIPGKRHALRLKYTIFFTWENYLQAPCALSIQTIDGIKSVVDGMAIVHGTCAEMYAQQGDVYQSERHRKDDERLMGKDGTGKFWTRIHQLKGNQNTGQRIALDDRCTFDEDMNMPARVIPNWYRGPMTNTGAQFLGSD